MSREMKSVMLSVQPKRCEHYIRECCRCKCEFISVSSKSYVCPECKKENKRKLDATRNQEYKKIKRDIHNEQGNIFADVREIDRYNAKHGTRYSYGQYKLLQFLKKL